mmetsp:Transcript_38382/g.43981  ORF Transcript_38382/g.43981 Transcript_38382/m.43981 type:complete len:331 (+) Transcript_38382:244-1236(+)
MAKSRFEDSSKEEESLGEVKYKYEIQMRHMQIEISMLRTKLDEQIQTNIATNRLITLENKSLDLLIKQLETYLESAKESHNKVCQERDDSSKESIPDLDQQFVKDEDIFLTKETLASIRSDSDTPISHKHESLSTEFEERYSRLKTRIDELIKHNKKVSDEFAAERKLEQMSETKTDKENDSTTNIIDSPKLSEGESLRKKIHFGDIREDRSAYNTVIVDSYQQQFATYDKCCTPSRYKPNGGRTGEVYIYHAKESPMSFVVPQYCRNKAYSVNNDALNYISMDSLRDRTESLPSEPDGSSKVIAWMKDEDAKYCSICMQTFWLFSRKHH